MTCKELLDRGIYILKEAGIVEYQQNAWYLFEYVTGFSRAKYFLSLDEIIDEKTAQVFLDLIKMRCRRIPISYITQSREFMGLSFFVNEDVLIPEPETELLVEEVFKYSKGKGKRILDMCTGSGCIAISIAFYDKYSKVFASDISNKALDVAKKNEEKILKTNKITFIQGDLFENIKGKYDIVVSNPPYIRTSEIKSLMPEVRDFMPKLALDGASDGLRFYRNITKKLPMYLESDGMIFYEIGYDQGEKVSELLKENGFTDVDIIKDYAGLDRIVTGRRNFNV